MSLLQGIEFKFHISRLVESKKHERQGHTSEKQPAVMNSATCTTVRKSSDCLNLIAMDLTPSFLYVGRADLLAFSGASSGEKLELTNCREISISIWVDA